MPSPVPARSSRSTKGEQIHVKNQRHSRLERSGVSQQSQYGGTSGFARQSRRSNRNLGLGAREDGRWKETSTDRGWPMPDTSRLLSELQLCAGLPDAIHRVPFFDFMLPPTPEPAR